METTTFKAEAEIELDHWWFAGRRRLFAREIARQGIGSLSKVLDVGTSTGTNLRMLRDAKFANFVGVDSSEYALKLCIAKGLGPVVKGDIARLPFPDGLIDLVLATDVIEHVDDDRAAIREIARILRPGGAVLITVPTFPILWGFQDVVAQHKRRYYRRELEDLLSGAGLTIKRSYYFNYVLFFPILLARQILRFLRPNIRSENAINSPILNRLLRALFAFDVATAPLVRPPFGVSALVLAAKAVD